MCTVSIVRTGIDGNAGYRLLHSRDEQRDRAAGLPPAWREVGGRRVIGPTDPDAGGTWLLTREDGATFAMLNVNPTPPPPLPADRLSRGTIPGRVLPAGGVEEAEELVMGLEARRFPPFRVVAVFPEVGCGFVARSWRWDGAELARETDAAGMAVCWASSGLGDHVVADRLPLFEEMVGRDGGPAEQGAYHRHRWPDRLEASVLMSRRDARTVSVLEVLVGGGSVEVTDLGLSGE